MASQWHYAKGGVQHGPVSAQRLKELAASGELAPADLVWKEGLPEWCAASTLKGLFPEVQARPADPPSLPTETPNAQPLFPRPQVELDAVSLRPRRHGRSSPASPFARLVAGGVLLALVFVCGFLLGRTQSSDSQLAGVLARNSSNPGASTPGAAKQEILRVARGVSEQEYVLAKLIISLREENDLPWSAVEGNFWQLSSEKTKAAFVGWKQACIRAGATPQ